MSVIIYVIIALAALLGAVGAASRIRARQRVEAKLDRIIELLQHGPS